MNVAVAQAVGLTAPSVPSFVTLAVEEVRGELLLGAFAPGDDYERVRPLFDEFADAVDSQALSAVDIYSLQIEALGIRLADGTPVWDVQIYPDGGASCRIGRRGDRNGTH